MMKHEEYRQKLPDYALNLLPPKQLVIIENHVAHCVSCRQALQRERTVAHLVQSSVNTASKPNAIRLRELMPKPPQKRRAHWQLQGWRKQLAPLMLVLFLAFGVLLTQIAKPSGSLPAFVSTAHAATATSTNTPTATTAQALSLEQSASETGQEMTELGSQTAPRPSGFPQTPLTTPEPQPTPVAAAMHLLVQ